MATASAACIVMKINRRHANNSFLSSHHPTKSFMKKSTKLCFSKSSLEPNPPKANKKMNVTSAGSSSPEEGDLSYLWKLGGGSVFGAVVIKYGSVLFPEITRPNLSQALIMILTPMVLAVFLLVQQTEKHNPSSSS